MKMVKCHCQSIEKSDIDVKWLYYQLTFNSDFDVVVVVVVALLFYVHGKHLRSCRDGQLT